MRVILAVLVAVVAGTAPVAHAQQAASCEDTLREARILVGSTMTSRTRQEIEAAQAIAARDKEIERLRAELAAKKEPEKK